MPSSLNYDYETDVNWYIFSIRNWSLFFNDFLPSGTKWMFTNAFFSSCSNFSVKFIAVNFEEHLSQKKKSLVNPSKSVYISFIKLIVIYTESNKLTALNNTDKVKLIFIVAEKPFFHSFHNIKLRMLICADQIEMNGAEFLREFALQFFPTFLLKECK